MATWCHVRLLLLVLLSLPHGTAHASDSTPASIRWYALSGNDVDGAETSLAAARAGCDRLRKTLRPDTQRSIQLTHCGDSIAATANSRNFRVDYALKVHDHTFDQDTVTNSSFLIQRRASCPDAGFPYRREDDADRFLYSCWRCPVADQRSQAPVFVDTDSVRWYRNNQCPLDLNPRQEADGTATKPRPMPANRKLPIATSLGVLDYARLQVLRSSEHGQLVELRLGNGELWFFVGANADVTELLPAKPERGKLLAESNQWRLQLPNRTEFRFDRLADAASPVREKRSSDGSRWRYHWQAVGNSRDPAAVQLASLEDGNRTHYQLFYDRQGNFSRLILKGADGQQRLAAGSADQPMTAERQ